MSLCSWLDWEEAPPPKENVEPAKKVYQEIEETARLLNVSSSRCSKVEDLFASDILQTRFKIQNLCETLISNYSPSLYGFCAREKLWKYVYYDAVQRARKLQRERPWSHLQLAYIKAHIETGIAKLYVFVSKIQEAAEIDCKPLMSHPSSLDSILNENTFVIQKSRVTTEDDKKDQKKLIELLAMCYINMGDLYRYLKDIYAKATPYSFGLEVVENDSDYFYRAQEWYTQAFLMNPTTGLSLNQLGNIYSDQGWGIDSAYYLLYSTLTENPYEGAFPNLRHMLDTKMVQFARRPALPEPKPMELLCNGFTRLLYQLLFEETQINYELFCQEALTNFHERLVTYDPELDDNLIFKFSAISVMVVWRLQATNSVHTSPAVAFAMSIFFTLMTQLGVILEQHSTISNKVEVEKDLDEASVTSSTTNVNNNAGHHFAQHGIQQTNEEVNQPESRIEAKQQQQGGDKKQKSRRNCRGPRFRASSIPSLKSLDSDHELGGSDVEEQQDDDSDYLWSESQGSESGESSNEEEEEVEDGYKGSWKEIRDRGLKRSHVEAAVNDDSGVTSLNKAFSSSSSNGGRSEPSTGGSGNNSQKSIEGLKQELLEAFHTTGKTTPIDQINIGEEDQCGIETVGLLNCQSQIQPLLIALTPFIRWLQTSPAVKDALAANAEKVFLEKLCGILTVLASSNWAQVLPEDDENNENRKDENVKKELANDWENLLGTSATSESQDANNDSSTTLSEENLFTFQLSEDRSMLGMPALKNFVQGLKINDQLTQNDQLTTRIGRLLSFGMWMTKTESFSMMYAEKGRKFFVPSPEILKRHLRACKIKQLLKGTHGSENLNRLTRAYQDMKLETRNRNRNRDGRRFRNRRDRDNPAGGGAEDRNCRRARNNGGRRTGLRTIGQRHVDEKPICIIVDLDCCLKYTETVKRLSCNKKFIVFLPHSVFEGLDMMKDTHEEMSNVAKECYYWVDAAVKRNHPGIKILKSSEKKQLNMEYPPATNDIEMWEYYEMLECCHFLISTMFEGNPYNYIHSAFGDQRDKYSVFYLAGNDSLLDTTIKRGFDPIKIARSLPGVYVDCIAEYPASSTVARTRARPQSPRRINGRTKWQTSGKCNG